MGEESHSEESHDPYDELEEIIQETEEKGKELLEKGRDLTKAGQFIVDLSRATLDLTKIYRPPTNIEYMISDWSASKQTLDDALIKIDTIQISTVNSTTGTTAYTSSDSYQATYITSVLPQDVSTEIISKIDNLNSVVNRATNVDDVSKLLTSFGFNKSTEGKKCALDLFTTAHNAFEAPVQSDNPISTSLIPMREAINIVIATLLQRRPKQEKTKSAWNKIQSIGKQLKHDEIPDRLVDSWAFQWNTLLNNYLSPAKQEDISRKDWQHRLQQATLFLSNFFNGLDINKMRM